VHATLALTPALAPQEGDPLNLEEVEEEAAEFRSRIRRLAEGEPDSA
jgi:hypothetical protein